MSCSLPFFHFLAHHNKPQSTINHPLQQPVFLYTYTTSRPKNFRPHHLQTSKLNMPPKWNDETEKKLLMALVHLFEKTSKASFPKWADVADLMGSDFSAGAIRFVNVSPGHSSNPTKLM